ncbi:MAG: GatB/YqeY domain-containing protein [Anaerolineae bacterium]|nr:GatB/YqeY domain-containing protein [Anaerolineae bacterium]
MGLREKLMDDLKVAMREKDETRKRAIRSVLAGIKKGETELGSDGQRVSMDDDAILRVIAKQAKERQESIDAFRSGGRDDLVAREEADLAVLQEYLPQQMSREEVEAVAQQVIAEVGATGPHDIGKVMKPLMARLKGRADGRLANQIVRELLAG